MAQGPKPKGTNPKGTKDNSLILYTTTHAQGLSLYRQTLEALFRCELLFTFLQRWLKRGLYRGLLSGSLRGIEGV